MFSVYLTLSLRYLRRRWFYALLIVFSIAAGVSLVVATRAINRTMSQAAKTTATPMAGAVDFILASDTCIERGLAKELADIGQAKPRIFENVKLTLADGTARTVLLVGIDFADEQREGLSSGLKLDFSPALLFSSRPVIVGKTLDAELSKLPKLQVHANANKTPTMLTRAGVLDAHGPAASLGGNVLIVDLATAAEILGLPRGQVHRIDITLAAGADREKVRQELTRIVAGRADVRSPQERDQAVQNVMSGMQTALLLCGIAALVVGLFLVYNALAVSVAERRHEIGILLAVGATRGQIRTLFAGEAALLGFAGSLLGIPLGILFAYFALEPVRGVIQEIFFSVSSTAVELDGWLIPIALGAGVATAVAAALVPAIQASNEKPAEAVRRMPATTKLRHRLLQAVVSASLLAGGVLLVTARSHLPTRFGMYAGLGLVVVAGLLATPLFTALAARAMQPFSRKFFSLEARLAADNLIRSPGRTGIVIAALAAGVALFMQTAGTIKSNRIAIRQWVEESIAADIFVTSGSPVGAGGQTKSMDPGLPREFEKIPGVDRVLAARMRKPIFQGTQIMMLVIDAAAAHEVDSRRDVKRQSLELYHKLSETKNGVIISDNFAAIHGVGIGDAIPLPSRSGFVEFVVIGQMADYSWNHGTIFLNTRDYDAYWDDPRVDVIDVYLDPTAASGHKERVREELLKKHAEHGLVALTREELHDHIDGMIHRLYGIAYGQQFVVLFVAALGVVTALLISVLQRRREMGLLRAIGASRWHIIRCVLAEAALMGIFGSFIGFLAGIPLEWFTLSIVIAEESGYQFPVVVPWLEALLIAGAAILVATLAGLAPSLYAARQRIPEAIAME